MIKDNIEGIVGYLNIMMEKLDITEPNEGDLYTKIAEILSIINENRLTTSSFFSTKTKEENLAKMEIIANKEVLYAQIVNEYLDMKGTGKYTQQLGDYIEKSQQGGEETVNEEEATGVL